MSGIRPAGEVETANVWRLYDRHAAAFDSKRDRSMFEKSYLHRFVDPPVGRCLDLGCGSGEPLAAYLIAHGVSITGIDAAPAMIAICKRRFPRHEWMTADMRGLNLGRGFGAILAWDSFFHLPASDQETMFQVFADHCLPEGLLLFTSGPEETVALGELEGETLFHASLSAERYRALLAGHGFSVLRHRAADPECGGHTVWLAIRRR